MLESESRQPLVAIGQLCRYLLDLVFAALRSLVSRDLLRAGNAPSGSTVEISPAKNRRLVFLLSDHVIDFDSYLPVALALKQARPEFDIRFVTFSRDNGDFIGANPTLVAGLSRCGRLYVMDGAAASRVWRSLTRLRDFGRIAAWLIARPGSVVFHGRQFSDPPYAALYLINRSFGGRGYLLLRARQPDDGIKVNILPRFNVPPGQASWVERIFRRDHDGMIVYHNRQELYIHTLNRFGRVGTAPRLVIGLPNLWPAWRRLIEEEAARELSELQTQGLGSGEIITLLAPKSFSSKYLQATDSAERSFRRALAALRDRRPEATVLIRPHPRAFREAWFARAVAEFGGPRVRVTLAHPDVLILLSSRVIAPNTSTVMMVTDHGRFIDCTDYAEEHFRALGRASQCEGFGTVWIDPSAHDFEDQLIFLLDDAAWPSASEMTERRARLTKNNLVGVSALLEWIARRPGRIASH